MFEFLIYSDNSLIVENSKVHALNGHMLALFLTQALIDALEELLNHPNDDSASLLQELQGQEDDVFQKFKQADLPDVAYDLYNPEDPDPDVDIELLYKAPRVYCHIGKVSTTAQHLLA